MVARAVATPIVVDLGEDDPGAVARPDRQAYPDLADGLDVLPRRKVADPKLEPLRPVIIGERRHEFAVRADLERAQPEIFAALGLDRLVEQHLVGAAKAGF